MVVTSVRVWQFLVRAAAVCEQGELSDALGEPQRGHLLTFERVTFPSTRSIHAREKLGKNQSRSSSSAPFVLSLTLPPVTSISGSSRHSKSPRPRGC